MMLRLSILLSFILLITGCGFHLQGPKPLAPPLNILYLQTPDPYGTLSRALKQYLKLSHVELVPIPQAAKTVLVIMHDETSQELLSVNATQQTRQYNLRVTVIFEITESSGRVIVGPQTLTETRVITIQSNQILGSSNETNLFYQQMRRMLAYEIMNRIASREITRVIIDNYTPQTSASS